ncbi:hypothetical protein [Alistipes sp.]|uniref:hypothetical protein n=1 Tax=Alistipes sp. TaxID=1872444 RepID=UPI003AB77E91
MKRLLLAILLLPGVGTAAAAPGISGAAGAGFTGRAFADGCTEAAPSPFFPSAEAPDAGMTALPSAPSDVAEADEILGKVTAGFRALGAYGVAFEVAADEYAARGRYAVEGEGYYLVLGDAEVYCDGTVRYEVDNRRREVTIDQVDTASRNILNNPVRAFDFLGSEYTASLVGAQQGRAVILLTPTSANTSSSGTITLTVDTAAMRPLSLSYDYDGERVSVAVLGISPLASPLESFEKGKYDGYEFIDFR